MVSRNNDINRIDSPIEMAIRMLEANQEDVFNSIIGPEPAARKFGKINGQDVDSVLDQVVRNAQLMGQQQQSVTAPPPIETPTPAPMPAPAPPSEPAPTGEQMQSPMGVPQSSMDELANMFGRGMNNGNA